MKNRKKLILFDFDGVIVDSFEYCLKINRTQHFDMTPELYRKFFEGNFYETFVKLMGKDKLTAKSKQEYWLAFMQGIDEILLYEGMKEVLSLLQKDYHLALVTSTISTAIIAIMQREGMAGYFEKVYGHEVAESKVVKFELALKDFNVQSGDCVFITDTLGDLLEAEKAGIESIAVSWGFHDAKTLERGKYRSIIHKPKHLVLEIEKHFSKLAN